MGATARQASGAARIGSLWYFAVPLLSLGLLTFLPYVHAAVRLRRLWVWLATVVFALVAVGVFHVSGQPDDAVSPAVDAVFVVAVLASMVGGTAMLVPLRREVYGLGGHQPSAPPVPPVNPPVAPALDPAVHQVLQARAKRVEARSLAAADALMARELGIGRPDLAGDYDDGGLVDLASAPEPVIAEVCGLTPEQAAEIVSVRDTLVTVDDVFSMVDLPVSTWDRIRDRAVVIR